MALRLMTYNVRYFGHATRGIVSTHRGVRRIARTLAAMQPLIDVLCLQEVEARSLRSLLVTGRFAPQRLLGGRLLKRRSIESRRVMHRRRGGRTQLEALTHELDLALRERGIDDHYEALYFPAHTYQLTASTNLYTTGLAVLTRRRVQIAEHNAHQVTDITHRRGAQRLKQTRICAHVALQVPGVGALDVFNTHMSLPGPFYPEFWTSEARFGFGPNQLVEARRLAEFINHRRSAPGALVVGDFNSLPGSPVDELLRREIGMHDAFVAGAHAASAQLRAWPTAGFMSKRMNIDRIYSTPTIRWLDFEGSQPFDGSRGAGPFAGLSDHVPLVGRLALRSAVEDSPPPGDGPPAAEDGPASG